MILSITTTAKINSNFVLQQVRRTRITTCIFSGMRYNVGFCIDIMFNRCTTRTSAILDLVSLVEHAAHKIDTKLGLIIPNFAILMSLQNSSLDSWAVLVAQSGTWIGEYTTQLSASLPPSYHVGWQISKLKFCIEMSNLSIVYYLDYSLFSLVENTYYLRPYLKALFG